MQLAHELGGLTSGDNSEVSVVLSGPSLMLGYSLDCFYMKKTKANLPSKICPVCQLPFTWRKKWKKRGPM